jgi:two-component system, chemotaxis family, protein-glutamate methylesterase/glutaminase
VTVGITRAGRRDIIVIGASAGGVEALSVLLANLSGDLRAAVAVTLHRRPVVSFLKEVLGRRSQLPVVEATDRMVFKKGRVHLAPPDRHLLFGDGVIGLDRGPKYHHTRPAIDPMFESAAKRYGRRVVGVLLTGNMSDGVMGLNDIKAAGGLSLVQRPDDASYPSMPRNAVLFDHVDRLFRLASAHLLLEAVVATGAVPADAGDPPPPPLAAR